MNLYDDLKFRGLISQSTDPKNLETLLSAPMTTYCGFDPTAASLHLGHLLPIITLRRFQLYGHRPIALVGGATGLIGDPSGKADERTLNTPETVAEWGTNLKNQLSRFVESNESHSGLLVLNNYDWISKLSTIDLLRNVGKYFSVPNMLAKESVKMRLENGISFTEFSYIILQAYDFAYLADKYNCLLQMGGSEQWGNITSGIDLIRKMYGKEGQGFTLPLLLKSDGKKMGKSESGAIWLDAKMTSPYQFYQFWINTTDQDAVKYLKLFTFLSHEEIGRIEADFLKTPETRSAQKVLAGELTTFAHGKAALETAQKISNSLFYGNIKELTEQELNDALYDVPKTPLAGAEQNLADMIAVPAISGSKRQAREDIKNGAVSVNGEKCTDQAKIIGAADKLFGKYVLVRRGKKNYHLFS